MDIAVQVAAPGSGSPMPSDHVVSPGTRLLGFRARLKKRVLDPTVLAGPPTAAALCVLRLVGLTAPLPYWSIVALVLFAQVASITSAALWAEQPRGWSLRAYVAVVMGVIAAVAYSTGWGPILSIGFIFGAAYALQLSGSAAARPAVVFSVLYMGLGQLAISLHVAPSLIREPLVHGLAVLGLIGVLLTIFLLARSTTDRETVEAELSHSERRFKALVRNASDIIIVTDSSGITRYVSPAFGRILGLSPDEFSNRSVSDLLHPDDLATLRSQGSIDALHMELRLQSADGSWRWFEASVSDHLQDPDVHGIVANLHDITDRKFTEEALREAHARFQSAFESAPIGMAMADLEGKIIRANRAYGEILSRSPDELLGTSANDLTHPEDRQASQLEMHRLLSGQIDRYQMEKRYIRADGRVVWVMVSVSCVRDSQDRPLYTIGQAEDITERRALRENLAHAAMHDQLTGLPNRDLFKDRLEKALSRSQRHDGNVAVIFLDLDRFKLVNDSLGHDKGDNAAAFGSEQAGGDS